MDQIFKFLRKLEPKKQRAIKDILEKLYSKDFTNADIKKLKGEKDTFRIRKGDVRVIYTATKGIIKVLKIDFRSDTTY
jgi:mRNA-degrading endonuclease RelE of RelBE toxin-antitoxin system